MPYVKYAGTTVGGEPTIQVSGANVQIVSGLAHEYETNGAGNVVIGPDEKARTQSGSNNLVLGGEQEYTSYGAHSPKPTRYAGAVLRLWLIRMLPFMSRWIEASPAACCGVCGTCLTATASGLTIEAFGKHRAKRDEPSD